MPPGRERQRPRSPGVASLPSAPAGEEKANTHAGHRQRSESEACGPLKDADLDERPGAAHVAGGRNAGSRRYP